MATTYFQGNYLHPQHISVGGILTNKKGEICCHHFYTKDLKGYWADEKLDDFYILMRETPEPNETLERALHRGLQEEFGATGKIIDYVGSIKSAFKHKEIEIEKTTIYFLCELISQDLSKRTGDDIEVKSAVEWQMPDYLIPRMKEQAVRFGRTDVDESGILERMKARNIN
ncbi:MAG: NUDIX domain-containing protein [Candidatus Giovannonibacteria bacterium]|nr:NUDIX domain-containing protein [Candidatus Giovannonibacteria bacterium]